MAVVRRPKAEVKAAKAGDKGKSDRPDFGLTRFPPDPRLPKGYLSVSSARMFLKCPRQFEFRYVKGLIVPPGLALVEGVAHHAALEHDNKHRIERGKQVSSKVLTQLFSETFVKKSKDIDDWEGDNEKSVLLRGALLLKRWEQVSGWLQPTSAESKFEELIGGAPFLGFIDVLTAKEVWDFKVVGRAKSEADAKNDLQLQAYSLVTGKRKAGFVSLVKNATKPESMVQKVQVTVSDEDRANAATVFGSVADAIRKGSFPHTDPANWWCSPRFCGYYRLCKGGK